MRRPALALALLACIAPAQAATFSISGFAGNIPIVDISGMIVDGDDSRFKLFANALQFAVVRLDSRGGHLLSALAIGEVVRAKGFATYVSPGHICASSCGYLWLAGAPRGKAPDAHIGFHAAYAAVDGKNEEVGAPNAIIGVYMTQLHLSLGAVIWATIPKPDQMAWITPDIGQSIGIAYDTREEVETTRWSEQNAPAPVVAAAPSATPGAPLQLVRPDPSTLPKPPKAPERPFEPVKRAEVKPPPSEGWPRPKVVGTYEVHPDGTMIPTANSALKPAPHARPAPGAAAPTE